MKSEVMERRIMPVLRSGKIPLKIIEASVLVVELEKELKEFNLRFPLSLSQIDILLGKLKKLKTARLRLKKWHK